MVAWKHPPLTISLISCIFLGCRIENRQTFPHGAVTAEGGVIVSKSLLGPLVILVKLGPKIGTIALKLLKGLKVGKVGFATASLAAYSYMFTWQFAALILFMLFVHESGHIWAMKRCGMHTKGIYFIPFFGAAAVTDEEFKTRNDESFIAIMGPIWGLGLAMLAGVIYYMTESPFFAAVSSWYAMINLFNLIPINPLDGGRITKSIAFSLHSRLGHVIMIAGLILAGFLAFKMKIGLFVLLLIIGSMELFGELFGNKWRAAKMAKKVKENLAGIEETYAHLMRIATQPENAEADQQLIDTALEWRIIYTEDPRQKLIETANAWRQFNIDQQNDYVAKNKPRDVPVMTTRQIMKSAAVYLLVAALLLGIMVTMNHVPGAAAAMDLLKD